MRIRQPILFGILASIAVAAHGEEPSVGDIFDVEPGQTFRGWVLSESGLGLQDQPYALFTKDGSIDEIVALTTPIVRTTKGGISVEKIEKIFKASKEAEEERLLGIDCSFATLSPVIAFYNRKTRIARGIFAVRGEILLRRWVVDDPDLCTYGGD